MRVVFLGAGLSDACSDEAVEAACSASALRDVLFNAVFRAAFFEAAFFEAAVFEAAVFEAAFFEAAFFEAAFFETAFFEAAFFEAAFLRTGLSGASSPAEARARDPLDRPAVSLPLALAVTELRRRGFFVLVSDAPSETRVSLAASMEVSTMK